VIAVRRLLHGIIAASMAAGMVVAFLGSNTLRWSPPPLPPGSVALSGARLAGAPGAARTRPARGSSQEIRPMARSVPASIYIPRIQVRAKIISLGLTPSGAAAVPSLATPFLTSWYDRGPTPGQPGTAVILGHVDSAQVGPAIFYNLGELRPGDLIYVTRQDRQTAVFRVYSAALYLKADFPTRTVYSYTSWPTLRLITCGGEFDKATGHYLGNIVVFAEYTGRQAGTKPP
jgi:sortase (surface protein transpeptidase)